MKKILALLVMLLLARTADACECSFVPLGTAEAQGARNVFVFRLMDARVDQDTHHRPGNSVAGNITILANVRGKTRAQQVHYSTSWCCGSRLEVGKYYIAFLSSNASRFEGNAGNLLPLWEGFGQLEADRLESVLRGKMKLEDAFSTSLNEINQVPPPPPPPCPSTDKKAG